MYDQEENINRSFVNELKSHKLKEIAEKSASNNGGSTAHYITANQALRDDLVHFMKANFKYMHTQIEELEQEVKASRAKEAELNEEIK